MSETPTKTVLNKMKVAELRGQLTELGLATNGIKADLVQRLFDHYQEQEAAADASNDDNTEEVSPSDVAEEAPPALDENAEDVDKSSDQEKAEVTEQLDASEKQEEPQSSEQEAPSKEPENTDEAQTEEQAPPIEEATLVEEKSLPEEENQSNVKESTPEEPVQEPSQVNPEPVPEPVKEKEPEPLKEKEPEPAAPSGLSLKITPPKVNPAGPPPVADDTEKFTNVNVVKSDKNVIEEMDTNDDVNSEPKDRSKKKSKKKKKKNRPEMWAKQALEAERKKKEEAERAANELNEVEVEYIQEELELDPLDPMYRTFSKIFATFKLIDPAEAKQMAEDEEARKHAEQFKKVPKLLEDDDMVEETETGEPKISKRKLKKQNRLSVAELKQLVARPDVVEMHDVTARDPRLLVHLKSTRNTVPVPRHWCFKRKYLQGKRGIEKPPFDLPEFIKKTGIMEMREALQEKEDQKGLKSKMREKVRPKLGKIDIDYQKLHDAFFKWQTKPKMTLHGDLYYEGKEFEIRLKEQKPGNLSDDLRTSLGMPVGPNAHKVPPPWLIAMQRYGPPPSYPNLKIPGLNAPIPDGCSFGYHAGGWGKPPVDEQGKPLYGDVFGTSDSRTYHALPVEEVDHTLWGEMDSESEEEESSDEEEEEEEEEAGPEASSGLQTPVVDAGMATPSGTTSVGAGLETPDNLELRKRRIEADMEGGETPQLPYQVIPEKKNDRIGNSMMGSAHTYDLGKRTGKGGREAAVELALNPEEVDMMDTEAMALRAEAALREQQNLLAKEDLSDMVAEHAAKQKNKRKAQAAKDDPKAKKYKEFKF